MIIRIHLLRLVDTKNSNSELVERRVLGRTSRKIIIKLMELKPEQINRFIQLHKNCEGFEKLSEDQKREIANGVANYYLSLFNIHQRIKKELKLGEKS